MRRALVVGRLLLTTVQQAHGAPMIDGASGSTEGGRSYSAMAIHLAPWRRDRHGERLPALALVVGWLKPARGTT